MLNKKVSWFQVDQSEYTKYQLQQVGPNTLLSLLKSKCFVFILNE